VSGEAQDPARRLLELSEAEQRIAASGDPEGLAAVQDEKATVFASLPAQLDAEQRNVLTRAYALQQRTIELLAVARDEVASELAKLDQGRAAMRGYTPAGIGDGRSVDTAA
jgi:hypothetical protein